MADEVRMLLPSQSGEDFQASLLSAFEHAVAREFKGTNGIKSCLCNVLEILPKAIRPATWKRTVCHHPRVNARITTTEEFSVDLPTRVGRILCHATML